MTELESSAPPEDYAAAGRRLYGDADRLFGEACFATSTHLFGLAAECAIKLFMGNIPGNRQIPYKHLPDLIEDAKLWLRGRRRPHLLSVISDPDYMHGWTIHTRYWPDGAFNQADCARFRQDARQTLLQLPNAI